MEPVSGEPQSEPITLYHWHHETALLHAVKTTTLTIEDLSHVSGFQALGQFEVASKPEGLDSFLDSLAKEALEELDYVCVSPAKDVPEDLDGVRNSLAKGIPEELDGIYDSLSVDAPADPQDDEIDETIISHIIESLTIESSLETSEPRNSVKMYMVSITCSDPNGLFEGEERVWRWRKPSSQYRKESTWLQTVDDAVADGAWAGGKDLTLLVEGITTCQKEEMFQDGERTINISAGTEPPKYSSV
jgi:hypothetical protein